MDQSSGSPGNSVLNKVSTRFSMSLKVKAKKQESKWVYASKISIKADETLKNKGFCTKLIGLLQFLLPSHSDASIPVNLHYLVFPSLILVNYFFTPQLSSISSHQKHYLPEPILWT